MAASSSLSSFSRTPTPFSRYHTADEGASNTGPEDVTDISSPGEAGEGEGDEHGADRLNHKASYHAARELPPELRNRVQIHLEEQTYVAALDLLTSLLCDNISHANASGKRVQVPPPAQLAVIATLAIQPKHTSRLASAAEHDVASLSLTFLRDVLATVGPVNGKLRDAFLFRGEGGRRRRSDETFPRHGSDSDEDHIRGRTANGGSIWARGQDFWKVLGWAFNCSASYPHRWRWWKPWLEYMLDVLELDYDERRQSDLEREGFGDGPDEDEDDDDHAGEQVPRECLMLQDSLLASYIMPRNSRSSPLKPIISSLFADGGPSSTSIYTEVFKNETKVASKSSKKRKRHHVDLENDNFGDYDEDSSTGGSEPPTPEHQRTSARVIDESVPWTNSALGETITFRLRLFALLSRAANDMPGRCNMKLADLYEKTVEKVAQLPVAAFEAFLAPHNSPLEEGPRVALIRLLLPRLLPSSIPQPHNVDPEADRLERTSNRIIERCYLPFAYRTAENNARLSLAIEALFRIMWSKGRIQWSRTLQQAVEKGVKARHDKSLPKKNSRKDDDESVARGTLRASGARLLSLAGVLKLQASMSA